MDDLKKELITFIDSLIIDSLIDIDLRGIIQRIEAVKKAVWHGEFLYILRRYFEENIYPLYPDIKLLGGNDLRSSSIIGGLLTSNLKDNSYLSGVVARTTIKGHGLKNQIINREVCGDNHSLIVVYDYLDFLCEKNLYETCHIFQEAGYKIKLICALVYDSPAIPKPPLVANEIFDADFISIINVDELENPVVKHHKISNQS
jgi:hypothetical protein